MPTIICPHCSAQLFAEERHDGAVLNCPDCRGQFQFNNTPPKQTEPPFVRAVPSDQPELKFCVECGARIRKQAVICPKCGVPQPGVRQPRYAHSDWPTADSNKLAAGLCGVLVGALGVHKFILGYTTEGVIMLLVSILGAFAFFLGPAAMGIIGLIEGITYLTMSNEDFHETYIVDRRGWF